MKFSEVGRADLKVYLSTINRDGDIYNYVAI